MGVDLRSIRRGMTHEQLLFGVLALAFLLRLIWALLIKVDPVSDSYAYFVLAQSVAQGSGYAWADGTATAYWPPGTSFIYGALFMVFGVSFAPIVALHLAAGVAVVYLGYRLSELVFNKSVALLTALLLAVWPLLIQFTTILASEILFLVPTLWAAVLVFEHRKPGWHHHALFGALLAVAAYIRPTALPLLLLIPMLGVVRNREWGRLFGWVVVGGIVCALLISPWSHRNTRLFGEFTTISTNFGANFWMGNNPTSSGGYQPIDQFAGETNEKRRDDTLRREAIRFISENPVGFLRLGIKRLVMTFDRETIGVVWNEKGIRERFGDSPLILNLFKLVSTAYWYLVLLAALVGTCLLLARERWRALVNPILVMGGFYAAIPAIMVGQDRYHMPMIPMLAALAAYATWQVSSQRSPRRASTEAATAGG
jgi:4-amino-4-deoxy-L-arabinose transferase-like glycosyltransferase